MAAVLEDTLYLDNIEEHVQDDNGIATYKWLSRTLEVPVDAAKKMLFAYVKKCAAGETPLSVVYTVSGKKTKEGQQEHVVALVTEDELDATKQEFDTISSVHIYSVQKSKPKHSGILFIADYDITRKHDYYHWSTIETTGIVTTDDTTPPDDRPVDELPDLQRTADAQDVNRIDKERSTTKKPPTISFPSTCTSTSTKSTKKTQKAGGKGSVADFFGKHKPPSSSPAPKIKLETVETPSAESKEQQHAPTSSPSKQPHTKPKSSTTNPSSVGSRFLNDSDYEASGDEEEKDISVQKQKQTMKENKPKQRKKKQETKSTSKTNAAPHTTTQRKRRRVQAMSSDDDSEPDNREPESTTVSTDQVNESSNRTKRRKRIRKLVSKLYTNKDGELVTEKHYEEVSTDASSEEDTAMPSTAANSKRPAKPTHKPSPTKAIKQSSLMSFFKK